MLLIQHESKYTRNTRIWFSELWNFEVKHSKWVKWCFTRWCIWPCLNVFSKNVKNLDTVYVSQEDFLEKSVTGYFSSLHLNIQNIKNKTKKFESFKKFLSCLDFTFGIMFFRDMVWWLGWFYFYDLENYISTHQKSNGRKVEGVSTYIHNPHNFKNRPELSTNCRDIESLALEITYQKNVTL